MHQLLPPTYRDVWLEWRDSDQQQQEESRTAANKPRDQFISRLLTKLKQQQNQGSGSQPQSVLNRDADQEPEESWENLAALEIGEVEKDQDSKCDKKRGRKVMAESFEASKGLFLKLKKSSLAHKLQVIPIQLCILYLTKKHTYRFTHFEGRARAASCLSTPASYR